MQKFRIGNGFDVHKFEDTVTNGNSVKICGVSVPHAHKLVGHSDADVGLHAIVDAILGAWRWVTSASISPPAMKSGGARIQQFFLSIVASLWPQEKAKLQTWM